MSRVVEERVLFSGQTLEEFLDSNKRSLEVLEEADPVGVMLRGTELLALLSVLQLSLRHPRVEGFPREVAVGVAQLLQQKICAIVPLLKPLCDAGWNRSFDM